MTSAFSWQNSISLCPASFCTPRPNLSVTPGVSWLPTFAFQSPIWKEHLLWVLVLKGLVGLHRTVQRQFLQHYWLGHRLRLLWYWMVCLGNEQRSFCHFWDCIQWSCMDGRVGLWRRLSTKELMLLNCGVGEDFWESLGLQGDPASPFWRRSALGFLWKEWY